MMRPSLISMGMMVILGCSEANYSADSQASDRDRKQDLSSKERNDSNDRSPTGHRRPDGSNDQDGLSDSNKITLNQDITAKPKDTTLHEEDSGQLNSTAPDVDLAGRWQLTSVSCPGGSLASNAQTENMLLANGSELTYVNVLEENNTGSQLEINLHIPSYGISCSMKQYFKLNYKSDEAIYLTTTSEVENTCPPQVNNLHVIEGLNYSTPATYEVQNGVATIRGKLPIRVTGQACDTGELAYHFAEKK